MFARLKLLTASPRGRRFVAGTGFIATALLASMSIFATGPNPQPAERTEKAWPVSVMEVVPSPLAPTFTAYGRVESSNVTHLRTDLIAEVESVNVREGDWVERGDVLMTLADDELALDLKEREAELKQLEANLASTRIEREMFEESTAHFRSMRGVAQKKLERHQDLMAKRLISQGLLDEVTAQANQANIDYQTHMRTLADFPNRLAAQEAAVERVRAQVGQVELEIDKTRVTAPFRGPILNVFVAPGDRSNIGAILVDIANADAFEVRVQIPERFGEGMHQNLSAGRTVTATTEDGLVLNLTRLSGQVKRGQSGLDAFFELDARQGAPETTLGRMLELDITLPEEQAVIALPVQSIYENDRIYAIRNVAKNPVAGLDGASHEYRLEAITVERVGEAQAEDGQHRILVRSPEISAGQKIITTQLPRAISGLLVEPA
jgi:multidrug efflux pump subunit AcrA (membrane-fusion protein)